VKVDGHNPDGWGKVLGYVMVAETEQPKGRGRPQLDDAWTPRAWVHPIRARLLGLPVAQRQDDTPIDYAHPMRKVAA
jgi:hypothetical protein